MKYLMILMLSTLCLADDDSPYFPSLADMMDDMYEIQSPVGSEVEQVRLQLTGAVGVDVGFMGLHVKPHVTFIWGSH